MENVKSILLIRLKSIGDVLLTLPAVSVVRQNFPAAKITFLTSRENAPLLRGFHDVDEVIAIDRAVLRGGNPLKVVPEFFGLLRRVRGGKFELAVDFQGYGETAWLARLTGAPQRWGCVYNPSRAWAYTHKTNFDRSLHAAESHLALLRAGGLKIGEVKNEFFLPAEALAAAEKFFAEQKLAPAKPTLFLQPFTSSPPKDWPLENFLALARHWQAHGGQIIFGGGPADRARLRPALDAGFVVSAGVPLLVTGGLMKLSRFTVGGDTGALHLAVAMGRRVLMLMDTSWPGHPHPFRRPDWTLSPPPARPVAEIPVAAVIAACESAVSGPAGNVFC
jgi:ADP-heptose:LPS heptosyltransferase